MFGLEREAPLLRANISKCNEGLEQEVSRVSAEEFRVHERPEKLYVPMPKHKICQICKESFEDYFKHVEGSRHRREAKIALGTTYIQDTISEFQLAVFD